MIRAWNPKRLIDITEDPENSGIFSSFSNNVPWSGDIQNVSLNLEYYYNRSGKKKPSPVVNYALGTNEKLTVAALTKLATMAEGLYLANWTKEYATLSFEYNPISNYDMTEEEGIERSHDNKIENTGTQTIADNTTESNSRGNNDTLTNTGTQTVTDRVSNTGTVSDSESGTNTGTQTIKIDGSLAVSKLGLVNNDIYGFNSSSAVNDRDTETTDSGTQTEDTTNLRTDDLASSRLNVRTDDLVSSRLNIREDNLSTERVQVNTEDLSSSRLSTRTDNLTTQDTGGNAETRTLTRSGNIGVTTSQQMIESERVLYIWNFFHMVVFPDLDKLLTLQTY